MKLIRLKITDPKGFRSLPCGFEHDFRSEWELQNELSSTEGFAPFVCAGPNGSGKSNLLEVLAAVFYQLDILRVKRSFLPEALQSDNLDFSPVAFELDYLIRIPKDYHLADSPEWGKVAVWKEAGEPVRFLWENQGDFDTDPNEMYRGGYSDIVLPQYVLGYSSGENEILSLPFFKTRFIQFDEYWNALIKQLPYSGYPDTRLVYLDASSSQAILLCNLLFQDEETLNPFREDVGIEALKEFRIILRRRITIDENQLATFDLMEEAQKPERRKRIIDTIMKSGQSTTETEERIENIVHREIVRGNSALSEDFDETGKTVYSLNLLKLLEGNEKTSKMVDALKRCATSYFYDEESDNLILDYWVNDATKEAFRANFENNALSLFQALQVLLTLNLFTVSNEIKTELYQSNSRYVSETVPTVASDERIMRIKHFYFTKQGVEIPMLLKELSDGEHQLIHSLGLCLLFRNTNSLFLLDEPETHFNPDWRANFVSRLRQCFPAKEKDGKAEQNDFAREMLITTHTPFLISDSTPEKVMVFKKEEGNVAIKKPDYNTLGASINKITMNTFGKKETIGAYAQGLLDGLRDRFEKGEEDKEALIDEIHKQLGDSVEKLLLIKAIIDSEETGVGETDN